jgi:DNA helicase HerA-like ATPase
MSDSIFLGGGGPDHKAPQNLLLSRANRHGLVAGATGTGKTVTLQIMAEQFSAAGVPVFCADVKGDLSGICIAGDPAARVSEKLQQRAADIGIPPIRSARPPAYSGTSMASAAIRYGQPSRRWVLSFSPGCCSSMRRRKAC